VNKDFQKFYHVEGSVGLFLHPLWSLPVPNRSTGTPGLKIPRLSLLQEKPVRHGDVIAIRWSFISMELFRLSTPGPLYGRLSVLGAQQRIRAVYTTGRLRVRIQAGYCTGRQRVDRCCTDNDGSVSITNNGQCLRWWAPWSMGILSGGSSSLLCIPRVYLDFLTRGVWSQC